MRKGSKLTKPRKPYCYWHDWNNVEKEIRDKFSNLLDVGLCPNLNMLYLVGISSKAPKMHGGYKLDGY